MRYVMLLATVLLAAPARSAAPPAGPVTKCPRDAVVSGSGCMDMYEASVWRVPNPTTTNGGLVKSIQRGTATAAALMAGGATLVGDRPEDYAPCTLAGDHCDGLYAVSLPGVLPSTSVNWFQAQAACTNSGKRLPSNAEWQAAVAGSPQPGPDDGTTDCATDAASRVPTGSRSACVSSDGAFDM